MLKIEGTTIYMTRGDDAEIQIDITDLSGEKYVLKDGDVLKLTVKKTVKEYDTAFEVVADADGLFTISASDTKSLEFGKYVYDVQLTSDGKIQTVVPCSNFMIEAEVTS